MLVPRLPRARGCAIASLMVFAGAAHAAAPLFRADVSTLCKYRVLGSAVDAGTDSDTDSHEDPAAGVGAFSESFVASPDELVSSGGTAAAHAQLKTVGARAVTHQGIDGGNDHADGTARATGSALTNNTLLTNEVPLGTPLTMAFDIIVNGRFDSSVDPGAASTLNTLLTTAFDLYLNDASVVHLEGQQNAFAPETDLPLAAGTYHFVASWINGQAMDFQMLASTFALGVANATGASVETYGESDFSYSWGGITTVTTADADRSVVITDYTFTDQAGNDWSTGYIPAPSALGVLAAFGVVSSRRRR